MLWLPVSHETIPSSTGETNQNAEVSPSRVKLPSFNRAKMMEY